MFYNVLGSNDMQITLQSRVSHKEPTDKLDTNDSNCIPCWNVVFMFMSSPFFCTSNTRLAMVFISFTVGDVLFLHRK